VPETRSEILHGRGKNAVAELFSKKLIVPKIFFDARWPSRTEQVDVLAVDRSGAGDVHVVEIKTISSHRLTATIRDLMRIPAQYKYLAYLDPSGGEAEPLFVSDSEPDKCLYAQDGLGRVGTIRLFQGGPGEALNAVFEVQPERFRVPANLFPEIDRYLDKHTPDIAIRA
jgi:hypothetical protein